VESLQECDVQLQAMARCDERIAKFEGLLAQMRTDLYGSIEALSSKIEKTMVAAAPPKRGVPRIVSNIQLAPPRTNSNMQDNSNPDEFGTQFSDLESWTSVVDKRRKKQVRLNAPVRENSNATSSKAGPSSKGNNTGSRSSFFSGGAPRKRPPKNAAVTIRTNPDGPSYAEVIRQAREGINLKELGINNLRMRRAANGGILIEISGSEGILKADALASRLREVIGENAVVARPVVMADIRVSGFDESVIKDELIAVVTDIGGWQVMSGLVRSGRCGTVLISRG